MKRFVNKVFKKGIVAIVLVTMFLVVISLAVKNTEQTDTEVSPVEKETKSLVFDDSVQQDHGIIPLASSYNRWYPDSNYQRDEYIQVYIGYNDYSNTTNGEVTHMNDNDRDGILTIASGYGKWYGYGTVYPAYIGDGTNPVGFNGKQIREIIFPSTTLQIRANAFRNNKSIEIIDLSQSNITSIGANAFEGCTNLKEIRLPNTLTSIGANAFKDCTNLVSKAEAGKYNNGLINLSSVKTIGANAFENDTNLIYITLGEGLTSLGAEAFKNCINIEQIALPDSITSLGARVFYGCTTMHTANVKTNILSEGLFEQCTSLNNVILNDTISVIPREAFKHASCSAINLPSALTKICYGAFEGSSINNFKLPDSTVELEARAFFECNTLSTFDLNKVEIIGDYAFANCVNPTFNSVTIPETVSVLGDHVFSGCTSLIEATIETDQLGTYMFAGCSRFTTPVYNKLSSITSTPEGIFENAIRFKDPQLLNASNVVEIGARAYYNTGFETVEVKNFVATVGSYAFAMCNSLTSIEVHSQLMGDHMFYDCDNLTTIVIGSEPAMVGDYACSKLNNLTNLTLSGTTYLGNYMFADCIKLTQVTIPSTVTFIGIHVFSRNVLLNTVTLESTILGEDMFEDCTSLKTIILSNITELTDYAFRKSYIEHITLPSTITTVGREVFAESALKTVTFEEGYGIIGEKMFYKCLGLTTIEIPSSVSEVRVSAFEGCTGIDSITMLNSVIGEKMFKDCTSLPSISIPDWITEIGDYAFENCSGLNSGPNAITLATKVLSKGMFKNCTSITEVTIPFGMTIASNVFEGCTALNTVHYHSEKISEEMFKDCQSLQNLDFVYTSAGISRNVLKEIGVRAFENCSSLSTISLPTSLTTIKEEAFKNCMAVTNLIIPNSVTSIGEAALYGCVNLETLNIPFVGSSLAKLNESYTDGSHVLGYIFGYGWEGGIDCSQRFSEDSTEEVVYTFPKTLSTVLLGKEVCLPFGAFSNSPMVHITLPSDSLQYISAYAFMGCQNLESITIPYSVKSIGEGAFKDCTSLVSCELVTSPTNNTSSLTSLPDKLFSGCTSLLNLRASYRGETQPFINIIDNIKQIGEYAFYNCSSIERVYINSNITAIPAHAFDGCTNMVMFGHENNLNETGLYVESFITSLGDYAFSNCDRFETITVPNTITDFGTFVFSYCDGVVSAIVETNVLPQGTFAFCSNLETTKLSIAIDSIGDSAFDHCRLFKNLIFEDDQTGIQLINNLTSVGARAFYLCSQVEELILGENLRTLGSYCFYGMTAFSEYEIPTTITTIYEGAFGGWTSLTTFTVPFIGQTRSRAEDGMEGTLGYMFGRQKEAETNISGTTQYYQHYDGNTNSGLSASAVFYIPTTIKTLVITDATMLAGCALYAVGFITSLILPDTLKTIYRHAIAYCSGLKELIIPNSVTTIYENALAGTSGLQKITLPFVGQTRAGTASHNQTFGYIFGRQGNVSGMRGLSNGYYTVYIPSGLSVVNIMDETVLNNTAFYNMLTIRELYISNRLQSSTTPFRLMSNLEVLSIPFVGTTRGNTGAIAATLGTMFGQNSGNGISATVQYYSASASASFYISNKLRTLYITDETVIGYGAIMNVSSLTKVVLNDGITAIHDRAFEGCTGLTSMEFPISVETVGGRVFDRCSGLESLVIPFVGSSVNDTSSLSNEFGRWFGTTSFAGSTAITQKSATYYVPTGLTHVEITNAKYLNDYAFYQYELLETILITSDQLQTIGNSCFYGCTKITEIEIPSTVTTIGDSAFENCINLMTVTNYEGITALGNKMFKGCTALENFEIKNNITSIGNSCFEDCVSLGISEVILPVWDSETEEWIPGIPTPNYKPTIQLNQVVSIGSMAFKGCTSLETITIPSSVNAIGDYAFENCISLTTLVHENEVLGNGIFKGCILLDDVVINAGTTNINDEAFMDCESLTNIILPNSINRIGDHAFENCTSLNEILLPEAVAYIGENAFKNSGLSYIVIPEAVVTVGDYAFEGSSNLKKATFNNSVLGLGMFKDCTDLRNAYITIGVTVIPEEAFMNCEKLTLITLHNQYLNFTQAYDASYSVDVKVEMSENTTDILTSAFENCIAIDHVNFTYIKLTGDRAFFNTGLTHVEVPATINQLGEELFASCKKLAKANIYKEELSVRIFMDCILLDNMNIIEGTTVIPTQAFKNCTNLTNVVIPYSLREYHKEAFMNTNIPTIVINPDVEVIQERVFAECDHITKAIIYTSFLGESMFEGADKLKTDRKSVV